MGIEFEQSHGKPRLTMRGVEAVPAAPDPHEGRDVSNGRFVKGNSASRLRRAKREAQGITLLNPKTCVEYVRPFAEMGPDFALQLAKRFDDPLLAPLVARTVNMRTLAEGLAQQVASGDMTYLSESLRASAEFRTCLVTLAQLAAKHPAPDEHEDPTAIIARIAAMPTPDYPRPDPGEKRDYFDE